MSFHNLRQQRPVGQGFFHTATLHEDEALKLRYVYDCGAMKSYDYARDASIATYLGEVGAGALLDVLFLSHIHADHVNGVELLLASPTGLQVDTIMLPLLHVEERLIGYARSITDDPATADSDFYRDMTVEPATALTRFRPRRILFVRPGDGDGGAPGSDGGPVRPVEDPLDRLPVSEGELKRPILKLVGRGQVDHQPDFSFGLDAETQARLAVVPDTMALAMVRLLESAQAGEQGYWLLAPFVGPMIVDDRIAFIEALARELRKPVASLCLELTNSAYVAELITAEIEALKAAYTSIATDLNLTSMSLYSGPEKLVVGEARYSRCDFGMWHASTISARVAWLGTGDAALKTHSRRSAFLNHYGQLVSQVITLTLPHHGSDGNMHPELIERVQPSFCVAAADHFSRWRHPGSATIQIVAASGRVVSAVTAAPDSRVHEHVWLGTPVIVT